MPAAVPAAHVKAVRAFNRFYTRRIGVLERYLDSDFTLTEVRVLYELAHRKACSASELVRDLGLDPGYLSRLLRRFGERGWVEREAAPDDARRTLLAMTVAGHAVFEPLQQKSRDEASALIAAVPPAARPKLVDALGTVQRLLEPAPAGQRNVVLRDPRPGDMGWVVQAHGEVYSREYGFDWRFEALVAEIAATFIRRFDPAHDKGWIAELDGQRVGAVFVVRQSATVAKLRMLVLQPEARGLGLGGRLVDACIAFARAQGYRKIVLWTHAKLAAARAIYQSRGFAMVKSEVQKTDYTARITSETWELKL